MAATTHHDDDRIDEILAYWFDGSGSARTGLWFAKDDRVTAEIEQRFGASLDAAGAGALDRWAESPRGRLALIIALDPLARRRHPDRALAFAHDAKAQRLCLEGIERGHDRSLSLLHRWFFYLPLQHAEDLALQDASVRCFEALAGEAPPDKRQLYTGALEHAVRHRAVIERFGRFPERNQALGRASTPDEEAYLASGDVL